MRPGAVGFCCWPDSDLLRDRSDVRFSRAKQTRCAQSEFFRVWWDSAPAVAARSPGARAAAATCGARTAATTCAARAAPATCAARAAAATSAANEPAAASSTAAATAEAAATTEAAATSAAAATAPTTAAAPGSLHNAANVFPIEEMERGETDVGHFLFAKNEALIGRGIVRLRDTGSGHCGC
jgi:hypothetical protein